MTWQDPGGNPAPGGAQGPDDDATRRDWDLAQLDALVGTGGAASAGPDAGGEPIPAAPGGEPPPGPPAPPPSVPPTPAYPPYPAPAGTQTPPPAGAYGTPAPGAVPPGMSWAPPDTGYGMVSPSGLRFADVGPRFVAWLVDVLLLSVVGLLISAVLSVVVLGSFDWSAFFRTAMQGGSVVPDSDMVGRLMLVSVVGSVISAVIDFVYFAFLWSSGGRGTIGMRLLRLEIGNAADGRTLPMAQAARRWVAMGSWLPVLSVVPVVGSVVGLAQVAWYIVLLVTTSSHPARQGLHDRFAGTAVVQREPAGNALLVGCLVIGGFLVLGAIVATVALVFLGSQVSTILEEVGTSI